MISLGGNLRSGVRQQGANPVPRRVSTRPASFQFQENRHDGGGRTTGSAGVRSSTRMGVGPSNAIIRNRAWSRCRGRRPAVARNAGNTGDFQGVRPGREQRPKPVRLSSTSLRWPSASPPPGSDRSRPACAGPTATPAPRRPPAPGPWAIRAVIRLAGAARRLNHQYAQRKTGDHCGCGGESGGPAARSPGWLR